MFGRERLSGILERARGGVTRTPLPSGQTTPAAPSSPRRNSPAGPTPNASPGASVCANAKSGSARSTRSGSLALTWLTSPLPTGASSLRLGSPTSGATSRPTYSANEMPSSAALACARRYRLRVHGDLCPCIHDGAVLPSADALRKFPKRNMTSIEFCRHSVAPRVFRKTDMIGR